jgi:hypothetical protein
MALDEALLMLAGVDPLAAALARCRCGQPAVGFVDVTPELAELWLSLNHRNRTLRANLIRSFASDMSEGRWRFEGSPIKFDITGQLIDGQHRLHAIVLASITVRMLVVVDIEADAMDVIDSGAKRTAGDMFRLHDRENAGVLAAVARLALGWQEGEIQSAGSNVSGRSNALLQATEAADPRLAWAARHGERLKHRVNSTPTGIAFFLWLVPDNESPDALEFVEAIAEHRTTGAGDPALAVIRRLVTYKEEAGFNRSIACAFVLARGWQAARAGETLQMIKLTGQHGPAEFPVLSEARRPASPKAE